MVPQLEYFQPNMVKVYIIITHALNLLLVIGKRF